MRMSSLMVKTLREAPADAEVASHALLLRAGYIRRLASGVYTLLPLGLRVLRRIEGIIRHELDAVGMQEILMPVLSPIELWDTSGRSARFGTDALPAMTVENRGGTFVLGPTHEEVVTTVVGAEVDSYRQLPLTVYQIQSKFRDEARPRFGLMRGRELLMCDAYSFDVDQEAMGRSYEAAVLGYRRIFERLSLEVEPVEAQSGAIGGDVNHEFMVPSPIGEDHFVRCSSCGYAANVEAARSARLLAQASSTDAYSEVATPSSSSINAVAKLLEIADLAYVLKSIAAFDEEGAPVLAVLPGDRELRLPHGWRLFEDSDFALHPNLVKGYIGPIGLEGLRVIVDSAIVEGSGPYVLGANHADAHLRGVVAGRDFVIGETMALAETQSGDPCGTCGAALELVRSVEAAHTFQLGFTYSSKMPGATVATENDGEVPLCMGCYGIGVSRLIAVIAEEHHDEAGLAWPSAVAPFDVHLLGLGMERNEDVAQAVAKIEAEMEATGLRVLTDDREASAGVKFADADLLGCPVRVTVGAKGLKAGTLEVKARLAQEAQDVPQAELLAAVGRLLA